MPSVPDPSNNVSKRVPSFMTSSRPPARPHAPPARPAPDEANHRTPTRFPVSEVAVSQADGEA